MLSISNSKKPICEASKTYQRQKLSQLEKAQLSREDYQKAYAHITAKACLCEDLAATALQKHNIASPRPLFSAVCPGPNLAYFSNIASLKEMVDHIYGKDQLITDKNRPNVFVKEIMMYCDHLKDELSRMLPKPAEKQIDTILEFKKNLIDGIDYYKSLLPKMSEETTKYKEKLALELGKLKQDIETMVSSFEKQLLNSNLQLNPKPLI